MEGKRHPISGHCRPVPNKIVKGCVKPVEGKAR